MIYFMKKLLLCWVNVFVFVTFAQAQIPAGYYDAAAGKSGYALKTSLYNIIKTHTDVGYGNLYKVYEGTYNSSPSSDKKPNGKVWDMYSDVPGGTPPYEFTWVQNCGNYSKESDCFNREHSFPQSWFAKASPMVSDAFHIYPTDGKVNGIRSNYPYGKVGTASTTSLNGSKLGSSASSGFSGTVFEPINEYKGDLARSMFYMATCYENLVGSWKTNGNADEILDGSNNQAFDSWFLNQMYEWHKADPVSQKEIDRNNAIYGAQGNRNPYIDHPEWVNVIWQIESADPLVQFAAFSALIQENVSGDKVYTVDVVINKTSYPAFTTSISVDGAGSTASSPADYTLNTTSLSFNGTETTKQVSITVKSDGITEPNETVKITLSAPSVATVLLGATSSHTLTIKDANALPDPITEAFDPCDLNTDWNSVSVTGAQAWACVATGRTGGGAGMNGYASGASNANQDWLITPTTSLGAGATISYWTRADFSGPVLELYVLSGYSGTGDPTSTATKVNAATFATPSGNSTGTWTQTSNLDLSSFAGTNKYIAFKYTSTATTNGAARWTVDDVTINPGTPPTATASLAVNVSSLTFNTNQGNASAEQSYTITGSNLTGNVTVTAPTNFEISLSPSSGYSATLNITPSSGSVNTVIYVRIKSSASSGTLGAANITNASAGVTTANVSVSGTVIAIGSPFISLSATSLSFTTIQGSASPSKNYTVTGSNLTGNVTVTAPTNFEISLSANSGYSATLSLIPTTGSLNIVIYMRISAVAPLGSLSAANVTHTGGGATTANLAVSGNVNAKGLEVTFDKTSSTIKEGQEQNILIAFSEPVATATSFTIQTTRATGLEYASDFTTTPVSKNDIISVSVPAGVSSISVLVKAAFDSNTETNEVLTLKISGTASELTIGTNNTYTLTIENVDVLSATENQESQEVSVYPNPAQNQILIQTGKNTQQYEIELYNLQGQMLQKGKSTDVLNVENYTNGLYILKFNNKNNAFVRKINIQK
jgi:endonuclease I